MDKRVEDADRRSRRERDDPEPRENSDSGLAEAKGVNDGEEDRIHQAVENQSSVRPDDYPEPNSMSDAGKGGEGARR